MRWSSCRWAACLAAVSCASPPPLPPAPAPPPAPALAPAHAPPPAPAPDLPPVPPEPPLPSDPAGRVSILQKKILAQRFEDEVIPAEVARVLPDFKQSSIDLLVEEVLAATKGKAPTAFPADEAIVDAIHGRAESAGALIAPEQGQAGPTGNGVWSASVTRSKQNPRIWVAGFYYAVPCGYDAGYAVFEIEPAGGLKHLLSLVSPPSTDIGPMFWELAFTVPSAGAGAATGKDFFFVASRITPHCQSALRQMQVLVVRPGPTPREPAVVVDETVDVHLMKPYRLEVKKSVVELEVHDGEKSTVRKLVVPAGPVPSK